MDRLIREVGHQVAGRLTEGGVESVDEVARELHEKLMLRGEEGRSLRIENICAFFLSLSLSLSLWALSHSFAGSGSSPPSLSGVGLIKLSWWICLAFRSGE